MELGISVKQTSGSHIITVSGEVDISNADALRASIEQGLAATDEVRLDFSAVSYIDSTGIGVLVGAARRAAEAGKRFSVVEVQPSVMRIVQLLGVDREMDISAA